MEGVFQVKHLRLLSIVLIGLLLFSQPPLASAQDQIDAIPAPSEEEQKESKEEKKKKPKQGSLSVRGYGIIGNLELRNLVKITQSDNRFPTLFDANFVEDAALILLSRLTEDGYLNASLSCTTSLQETNKTTLEWTRRQVAQVPRDFSADTIRFRITKGVLFYFEEIHFDGLTALTEKEAISSFYVADTLIPSRKQRAYNRRRSNDGQNNLANALQRLGYPDASVSEQSVHFNQDTGDVQLYLQVKEGRQAFIQSLTLTHGTASAELELEPGLVWSRVWQQDFAQEIIHDRFKDGFPDARMKITETDRKAEGDHDLIHLNAELNAGTRARIGEVRFDGNDYTRERRLRRRALIKTDDLFDPLEIDRARQRLARLGVFDSISVDSTAGTNASVRDVTFELKESRRVDLSLLFGVGSYERVRAGFELDQYNLFGTAHRYRLRGIQSLKATSSDFLYTMPDITSWELDAFVNGEGLHREEISFERQEFGGGIGVGYFVLPIKSRVTARYNIQSLLAENSQLTVPVGLEEAIVSSLIFDIKHDMRDNPIMPREGYKLFANLEIATKMIGGSSDFQRLDMAASWHKPLGGGRYFHIGGSHGVATTFGGQQLDLPFNKRFFPGGENSARGFQQGQASPLDNAGQIQGAATYAQGNIEFEQLLTPAWSLVTFIDAVGLARDIKSYPFSEGLYSVGGGLRWRTIIGPARIEYGHNLNPRQSDPKGTIHFSIGYPF